MADGVFTSVDTRLRGPLVRHNLAVLDREEGHLADAEKHWWTILDETPEYHPARLGLAELYLRQERWPELEPILAGLEPHALLDAPVLRARMHLARKEFVLARKLLEDVLGQAPHAMTANVFLSHVLLQSGDEHAAEPLLRRIVGMDPRQADSWRNLIVLYRRQNRLSEAIATARTGCWHCPHDTDLLLLQGALLQEGGDCTVEKEGHRTLGIENDSIQHTPKAWHTNQRSFCTMTARISLTMIVKNEAAMPRGRCRTGPGCVRLRRPLRCTMRPVSYVPGNAFILN